jgi:hypothetical protein
MGLGLYEKAKRWEEQFVNWIEADFSDRLWRAAMNHKLRKQYMQGKPAISPSDKRDVMAYWAPYTTKFNVNWHQFYACCSGKPDVRYIPDDLYYTAINHTFNNKRDSSSIADKNYLDKWFPQVKHAKVILRKINGIYYDQDYQILSEKEALSSCANHQELVIKPSLASHSGANIVFWQATEGESFAQAIQTKGKNLIVQEPIIQHAVLANLHPYSVNTIRSMTLLIDGKAHHLSSVLRMGINGSRVDNAGAGGLVCGIRPDGQLKDVAYSLQGVRYEQHPQGAVFEECTVPAYKQVIELVCKMQEQMANFRMISWDFTIDQAGEPVFIEANLQSGGSNVHQYCNGPLFGDLTERVLAEVFGSLGEE